MSQKSILIESTKENPESAELGVLKKTDVVALSDANAPATAPLVSGVSVM